MILILDDYKIMKIGENINEILKYLENLSQLLKIIVNVETFKLTARQCPLVPMSH